MSQARTASPSPLTPPSVLVDESALKRTFDSEFASSLASARSQLGDATVMAPKVVEAAFVHAWKERAAFTTQAELLSAIAEEIRHCSARALSRRASAGRFAGGKHTTGTHAIASEAPADVWAHIEKAIHTTGEEAHAAVATAGRHEAASAMKAVGKKASWIVPTSMGAAALVISVAGVMYVDRLGVDEAALSAVSSAAIQPIASSPGQIGSVMLGDASRMRIGPESKVFIADGFPTKVRALRLEGTAQFDVAPTTAEQPLPFRVIAKRVHMIATGTSFAVYAYPGDSVVMVQVKEGEVTVKAGKTETKLMAGRALYVDNGVPRDATADERAEGFGWVDGQITVKNKQLRAVVAALTRWFNYDVKVADLTLLDRPTSIDVPLDSSRLAISQVERSANVQFAYEGDSKVFRDATKKK